MNNMIIAFVNGTSTSEAGDVEIDEAAPEVLYVEFQDELMHFVQELAQLVMHNGKSATKFMIISVTGALSNANTSTPQLPMRTKHWCHASERT